MACLGRCEYILTKMASCQPQIFFCARAMSSKVTIGFSELIFPISIPNKDRIYQWEFLIYGRYLQFRNLKWPVKL
jgi:hypothetical protein